MRPPERIAVVGFGYVALPVVHAFARRFSSTMGFDVSGAHSAIVDVGVRRAPSIRVAEAAKAIEHTKAALDTDGLPIGLEYGGL